MRSGSKIDTPLTQPRSGPVRYEIVDKDGRKHGPFKNVISLCHYLNEVFLGQEQDEDRTGKGFDIQIVGAE